MSHLASCQSLKKSFGSRLIFDGLTINFREGERVGLVGPNGSGKSTLLKIMAGIESADSGEVILRKHARLVYLPQSESFPAEATVESVLLDGLDDPRISDEERFRQINRVAGQCGFTDLSVSCGVLSGGWRKRLAIARSVARQPDLLLLDEPTNHLDLEGILWLEKFISAASWAAIIISHDRYFLEATANRMVELNRLYRAGFLNVAGPYHTYLEEKETAIRVQNTQEQSMANRLRREIEWLRRGPKARTTKAQYRINEAKSLQEEYGELRGRNAANGRITVEFSATERRTRKLLEARGVSKRFEQRLLFSGLDLILSPGSRVGVLGRNGTGKSTLLKVLSGTEAPDSGSLIRADGLRVVFFEQQRRFPDMEVSLRRALAPEGDSVVYNGKSVHVAGWARRFLFRPEQLELPLARLSGGELARVAISRLMLEPADLLLLDEPTNDLDIPSIEVLEESLIEFPGAVVLVSHDRLLLDRLTDSVLGLDGQGGVQAYAEYGQWVEAMATAASAARKPPPPPPADRGRQEKKRKGLTYAEEIELGQIEARIAEAEAELAANQAAMDSHAVRSDAAALARLCEELRIAQDKVDGLYARWDDLETRKAGDG